MTTYVVAVADSLGAPLARYGPERASIEPLRAVVAAARDEHEHVYIVRAEELSRGLVARSAARRLAARPPADPDLPLAARHGVQRDARLALRLPSHVLERARSRAAALGITLPRYVQRLIEGDS